MFRSPNLLFAGPLLALCSVSPSQAQIGIPIGEPVTAEPLVAVQPSPPVPRPAAVAPARAPGRCADWEPQAMRRNPTEAELRCRYGITGPGRFGLLSYTDVPVYQPATPMPGTHVVGIAGHARPVTGESYEAWEWRMLRTDFGPEVHRVHRSLDVLHPVVAARIMQLEQRLREEGITPRRLETWRAPERQAFLFQQGRSRPGPLATTTLTSWHSQVDERGNPAGRAVDYSVPGSQMRRFHQVAREVGLESFGHDSNDPGHVFLPAQDELPEIDIVLLRVLPRVPEVTLATGLPVDRQLPPGGRSYLREEAGEFASEPFVPFPALSLSGAYTPPALVEQPGERISAAPDAYTAERVKPRARRAAAGGGAGGARSRTEGP